MYARQQQLLLCVLCGQNPEKTGNWGATGGFEVERDTRQYSVQNYLVTGKKRNMSATISMPPMAKTTPWVFFPAPFLTQ
jgi:hypothetical protein